MKSGQSNRAEDRCLIPLLAMSLFMAMLAELCEASIGESDIVVVTGEQVPDGNGSFAGLSSPVINDAGQVAFSATILDGPVASGGIYRDDGHSTSRIVRFGQPAPNGNGTISTFSQGNLSLSNVSLNNAGQVMFVATLSGTSGGNADNGRIFRGDGATLVQLASEGQAAPDGNGRLANLGLGDPNLNVAGQDVFRGVLTDTIGGTSDNLGVFVVDVAGNLNQVARAGQSAPDGNGQFSNFFATLLSDTGQVAFRFNLTNTTGGSVDASGIMRSIGTNLVEIARANQSAPDGNGRFANFNNSIPTLNNAGQVAFRCFMSNTIAGTADDTGIALGDGVSLTLIAREGQPAPDGNGSFSSFPNPPALNNAGQLVFVAILSDTTSGSTDDRGIFHWDGATVIQVARAGLPVPGGNGDFVGFTNPAFNDQGQLAFLAALGDTQGGATDDTGLYFYDDAKGLLPVAREGDALLGSTITQLSFSTTWADERRTLNNLGQVVYAFQLADGRSGIAVWSVPEPSTAIAAIACLVPLLTCRRKAVSNRVS